MYLLGMASGQVEPDLRAAAASQDVRRCDANGRQQAGGVVALNVGSPILGRAIEAAARVAARVVRHDRVPVREEPGKTHERTGVGGATRDHEQDRTGPSDFVIEPRARHLQGVCRHRIQ
jgi:hypothetical protein